MKIKAWQFEYEFDRDDAKIVIPIVLLLTAISATAVNPMWWLATLTIYCLLYFFAGTAIDAARTFLAKRNMRCPSCKNRKIFLQGYQGYKSDEQYPYYFFDSCETTAILTDGGLLKISS